MPAGRMATRSFDVVKEASGDQTRDKRFGYSWALVDERLHVVAQQFCLHLKHLGKSAGT
jgi:hypothetical protein